MGLGVMARLAKSTWCLESRTLRSTRATLFTRLAGYGFVDFASGAYKQNLRHLETQLVNVPARRITGISRSARLAAQHMTAQVPSAHNQYIRACALTLDRALRAYNRNIHTRLNTWAPKHSEHGPGTLRPLLSPDQRMRFQ